MNFIDGSEIKKVFLDLVIGRIFLFLFFIVLIVCVFLGYFESLCVVLFVIKFVKLYDFGL